MQKSWKNSLIKRGDIWIAKLEPSFGKEIKKQRPVLVVSGNKFNKNTPYVIIVPASSVIPKEKAEAIVLIGKPKGVNQQSVLLPLLIRSIDQERLIKKTGKLSKVKLEEVEESLKLVLGMIELD